MLRKIVERQASSSDEQMMSFEWSCRPVLIVANIFGIPLKMKGEKEDEPSYSAWMVYIFGWILYCTNVTTGLTVIFLCENAENVPSLSSGSGVFNNGTTASQWNSGISTYNTVSSMIATHTVLLAITAVRWEDLVRVLHRVERMNQFTRKEFSVFRAIFRVGLVFAIIVSFASCIRLPCVLVIHKYWCAGMSGCWLPVYFHVFHRRFEVVADAHPCCPAVANALHFAGCFIIHLFRMDGRDYAANSRKRNGIHSRQRTASAKL